MIYLIIYSPSHLHISDPNLLWISSHRHHISSQDFPGTLRSIFADCFWRTIFCSIQKFSNKNQNVSIMLTFMNSKLPDKLVILTRKSTFIIHVFYWCIPLDHEIYTKCNKKHLTWLKLDLVIISALELKVKKQKTI